MNAQHDTTNMTVLAVGARVQQPYQLISCLSLCALRPCVGAASIHLDSAIAGDVKVEPTGTRVRTFECSLLHNVKSFWARHEARGHQRGQSQQPSPWWRTKTQKNSRRV